jgi:REP element-mobilizing transposase RayT
MSFWRTYYHLVWTTKNRAPLIRAEIEPRLYAYMIRKAAELETYVYAINGYFDHVHLLVAIPPKIAVADVVKLIKGASSHDLGVQGIEFAWQRGYGVLTLGEKQRPVAEAYIANQKQHHAEHTTVTWLERCDEEDDPPTDHGLAAAHVPRIIREAHAPYVTQSESPF